MNKNTNYKTCNAINCFYCNEYLGVYDDYDENSSTQECKFCAYNYSNLAKSRKILAYELHKNKKNYLYIIKQKFVEILIKFLVFAAASVLIIYFFTYIKQILK